MDDKNSSRYEGRPLLILLENYAMSAIGQLPSDREASVSVAVAKLLGGDPTEWKTTVRSSSGLPADFDERLRQLWSIQEAGTNPVDFVMAVSEATFLPMIDPA
jgi:hypothetical protein